MSVRSLYKEWVFLPPTVPAPSSSSTASRSAPAHLPTPFSPTSSSDGGAGSSLDYGPLQLFAAEYFTTALGMPFEVGKTLLQIEYRPRRRFAVNDVPPTGTGADAGSGAAGAAGEEGYGTDEDGEGADAYFSDLPPRPARDTYTYGTADVGPGAGAGPSGRGSSVDADGYYPDLDPTWLLKDDPDISRGNGVWGMIRRVRATPTEGLPGLWKGQVVSTIHSLLSTILQPQIHSSLSLLAPSPDLPLAALPSPAVPLAIQVGSHLLAHLVLSPLELIRTRLIAMPTRRDTPSSVTLFNRTIEREGGLASMYLHPNLLIPAILEHTLRPLLTLSIPLLLERQLHISPDLSPVTYSLCDLSLNLASLLILLPIETVRKRLQVQSRGGGDKARIRTVVKVREQGYVGVVEAIWRIVTEETGVRRRRVMTEKEEGGVFAGIRQLYRGFGMAATAHVTVFSLGLVSASLGGRGFDGGWKEI